MRTTLNVDDDVLLAVQELARREKRTAGAVMSELARKGLNGGSAAEPAGGDGGFHGFRPWPNAGRTVTSELLDRLREDGPY